MKVLVIITFLIFSLLAFQSVKCEQHKTTVDKLMDKWREYVQSLETQEMFMKRTSAKTTPKIDDNLQELFQKLINKVMPIIMNLNPTFFDHIDFTTDSRLLRFKGYMNSVKLSGMNTISETKLNVTQNLDFEVGLGMESFMAEGNYDLDIDVLTLIPLYGAGDFGLLLTGMNISVTANFQEEPESLQATNLKLDFKLDKIKLEFNGLVGGGKLSTFINNVLSDVGADLVMQYKDTLLDLINPILRIEVNHQLAKNKITIEFVVNAIKEFLKHT